MLSSNDKPKWGNVYDPDPEKSYTKAKIQTHLEKNKENKANYSWVSSTTENEQEVLCSTDKVANEVLNNNFSVPKFVWIDAFPHVNNSGVIILMLIVVNSNDKGLRMMRFVHDLEVYKDPQKSYGKHKKKNWPYKKAAWYNYSASCDWMCDGRYFASFLSLRFARLISWLDSGPLKLRRNRRWQKIFPFLS